MKWFRLSAVPESERLAALRMQAQAWQPFESTSCWYCLEGESGLVLAWDRDRAHKDVSPFMADPARVRFLPEPMLRSSGQDGVRLLRCLEGVEGQVWHKGWLMASRWWVEMPTDQEWRLFLHAGGGGLLNQADIHLTQLEDVEWVDRPWGTLRSPDRESHQNLGLERRVGSIAALALTVGIAAVGRQLWDVNQSIVQREESLASLRDSAAEVLSSRDRALKSAAQAQQLANWLSEPLPIEVIGHLHDTLSKSGVLIKEIDLTGSKLRIGLQLSSQATRAAIVRDLQAGGWFKGVSEATGNSGGTGLMVLDMTLGGLRPPPQGLKPMAVATDSPSAARVSGSTK